TRPVSIAAVAAGRTQRFARSCYGQRSPPTGHDRRYRCMDQPNTHLTRRGALAARTLTTDLGTTSRAGSACARAPVVACLPAQAVPCRTVTRQVVLPPLSVCRVLYLVVTLSGRPGSSP